MAKVDIFMPLYVGDYLKDTGRLSTEQHGAYLLLMLEYWQHGKIPNNDDLLARIARLSPDAWSIAKASLLVFFKCEDGYLVHNRIERELEKAKANKERASARARKGAEARWGKKGNASSNATSNATSNASSIQEAELEQCSSPSHSDKENTKRNSVGIIIDEFLDSMSQERADLYREWFAYKRELKKMYKTEIGIKKFFNAIEREIPENDALAKSINNCIKNEYSGLHRYEPKGMNAKHPPKKQDGKKTVKDDYADFFKGKQ